MQKNKTLHASVRRVFVFLLFLLATRNAAAYGPPVMGRSSWTVSINGTAARTFNGLTSGDEARTASVTIPVTLFPGNNTIRLSSQTGRVPDVDFMQLDRRSPDAARASRQKSGLFCGSPLAFSYLCTP